MQSLPDGADSHGAAGAGTPSPSPEQTVPKSEPAAEPAPNLESPSGTPAGPSKWGVRLAGIGAVAVALAVAVVILRWSLSPDLPSNYSVADEWNATIHQLGIEPIYPPQEDFTVGDIFLSISQDSLTSNDSDSLLGRSLKIWHVDLSKDLKETYRNTFIFPNSKPRPKVSGEYWPQEAADNSIFDISENRRYLPLVLLPDFTLARLRQADLAGGWWSSIGSALGAVKSTGERTVELKIPFAETYSVPAIVANAALSRFCTDPRSRNICSEEPARGYLSTLVGDKILKKIKDPAGAEKYRLGIEIFIVSGVYLIRSIESVSHTGNSIGSQAKLVAKLNQTLQDIPPAAQSSPQTGAAVSSQSNPGADTEIAALRKALEESRAALQNSISQLSGAPGGAAVSVQSIDDSRIAITQHFQRPVAIGFRAIRNSLGDP